MRRQPIDPIISEVRAARVAHDVAAIFRDIRAMQEESGREYVRFPARPVVASDARSGIAIEVDAGENR